MKSFAYFFIALFLLPFAFKFCSPDPHSIGGTYVRQLDSELSTLYDTLQFTLASQKGGEWYQIDQRSATHFKKKEDQPLNKRGKRNTTGTYDREHRTMRTADPGLLYTFDLKKEIVMINSISYQKVHHP